MAVVRTSVDVKLFEHLAAKDGSPKTTDQLATACRIEFELAGEHYFLGPAWTRIMADDVRHRLATAAKMLRVLAAMNTIREVGAGEYAPSAVSRALANPTDTVSMKFMFVHL